MQVVLFGDFLQLGPIDNTNERARGQGFCPALVLNRGWSELRELDVERAQAHEAVSER